MRMPEPRLQIQAARACGGACPKRQTEQSGQEDVRLQTKRVQTSDAGETATPSIVKEVLATPGRALDSATREYMEPRFGHDFSRVKVHSDTLAAESAQAVGAKAYTVGRDIVFGARQYEPSADEGQKLLAHELTHVLQQREASAIPHALAVSKTGDMIERQAGQMAREMTSPSYNADCSGKRPLIDHHSTSGALLDVSQTTAPSLQREPTKPRAATGKESIADLTAQTTGSTTGKVTAGSLSKQEWESLFSRHFTEPDKVEDEVESSHARYLYSEIYGWIDAQHFFAHIQFAEDMGLQGATDKGIDIESKQETVRQMIGPSPNDPTMYSDFLEHNLINADDFLHYRETLFIAIALGMDAFLNKQEKALIKGFDERKLAKVILDNAMSAWSYEDLVSNQLGVQFFRLYGSFVNAGKDAVEVRQRFIDEMTEYFTAIQVVNDPATIKAKGAKLPGKERWTAPKMTEAEARKKYPELFEFGAGTHRLRVSIHDNQADAEKGKERLTKAAPSVPGLHVEPLGSQFAVYSGSVSHFEAVVMRALLNNAIHINLKAVVIEPMTAKVTPKP
ncbi:MAG: DUF4157 domain-containing protein [Chloracidobacterium sp.]|nr:DUF4157 domain-containing protein [Chloracidobacterium sp.]